MSDIENGFVEISITQCPDCGGDLYNPTVNVQSCEDCDEEYLAEVCFASGDELLWRLHPESGHPEEVAHRVNH